jgi:hypothetical protein|tara:strand:+ start:46 stop:282 length:237 start_codon:yes stop_codon:yes gene_type:complete
METFFVTILKVYSDTWCFAKVSTSVKGLELEKGVGFISTTKSFKKGDTIELPSDVNPKIETTTVTINGDETEMPRIRI